MHISNLNQALEFLSDLETGKKKIIESDFSLNIENKGKIVQLFKIFETKKIGEHYNDKIPLFEISENMINFRVVPGATIRRGVYIAKNVVIMPSFVNIGAHIGENTMIDSYVTAGSCVYIGANCHISSSSVLAGVLEPINHMPIIIEDNVFIGAQCLVAEGVRVKKNAVLAAGVHITASTKIIERQTGKMFDHVPENAVVVPGFYESITNNIKSIIQCAWVIRYVEGGKNNLSKLALNEILRN